MFKTGRTINRKMYLTNNKITLLINSISKNWAWFVITSYSIRITPDTPLTTKITLPIILIQYKKKCHLAKKDLNHYKKINITLAMCGMTPLVTSGISKLSIKQRFAAIGSFMDIANFRTV